MEKIDFDGLTEEQANEKIKQALAEKGRQGCGSCTKCCTIMRVEMAPLPLPDKEEGKPCQFLCKKGCSIYENKPSSCSAFICLWLATQLTDDPMPRRMRPDKCNVVMDVNSKGYIIAHTGTVNAWRESILYQFLLNLTLTTNVIISWGDGDSALLRPNGRLEELIPFGVAENGEITYRTRGLL